MTTILTVDDSRALRSIINKALSGSYSIIEAEDGEKGLEQLGCNSVDLVLLDVTMPVMDGPTMLKQMRERGIQTPVILLTAESKTSLIGECMSLGLSDYILKPFQAAELKEKVVQVLGKSGAGQPAYAASAPAAAPGSAPAAGRPFVDVLIIDDMPNVAKKFTSELPEHLKSESVTDGQSAMKQCREKIFRTVIVDTDIPDVNSSALTSQLRVLQPTAAFIGLYMRNQENPGKEAKAQGYDSFLVKPFNPTQIDQFLSTFYDTQDVVKVEENVLTPSAFPEGKERRTAFAGRLSTKTEEAIAAAAAACHESVILNLSSPPPAESFASFLVATQKQCGDMGLTLLIVSGSADVEKQMKGVAETAELALYKTVAEAQAAA